MRMVCGTLLVGRVVTSERVGDALCYYLQNVMGIGIVLEMDFRWAFLGSGSHWRH